MRKRAIPSRACIHIGAWANFLTPVGLVRHACQMAREASSPIPSLRWWLRRAPNTAARSADTPPSPGPASARGAARGTPSRRSSAPAARSWSRRASEARRRAQARPPPRREGRALGPARHRDRRARPCPRRRSRPGIPRPARGRARDREEHPGGDGAREHRRSGNDVLYVSGEESAAQVRRRAERLGEAALSVPMLAEPSLESVLAALESERPSRLRDRLRADPARFPMRPREASARSARRPRRCSRRRSGSTSP